MAYTARIGINGRLTIPKALRDRYGLDAGVTVEMELEDGRICLRKRADVLPALERFRGIINVGDVDAFIEDLRGRKGSQSPL